VSDKTSDKINKFFDIADSVLDKIDHLSTPADPVESSTSTSLTQWNESFSTVTWSPVRPRDGRDDKAVSAWHAFKPEAEKSVCGKEYRMGGKAVLEHGRVVAACATCLMGGVK
jgi:hypothetical protein